MKRGRVDATFTGKFVEFNRMVNRSRSEAGRIGAKSESCDSISVITNNFWVN